MMQEPSPTRSPSPRAVALLASSVVLWSIAIAGPARAGRYALDASATARIGAAMGVDRPLATGEALTVAVTRDVVRVVVGPEATPGCVVVFAHPSQAPPGGALAAGLVVSTAEGAGCAVSVEELLARLRASGEEARWTQVGDPDEPVATEQPPPSAPKPDWAGLEVARQRIEAGDAAGARKQLGALSPHTDSGFSVSVALAWLGAGDGERAASLARKIPDPVGPQAVLVSAMTSQPFPAGAYALQTGDTSTDPCVADRLVASLGRLNRPDLIRATAVARRATVPTCVAAWTDELRVIAVGLPVERPALSPEDGALLEQTLERFPDDPEALHEAGALFQALGDFQRSAEFFERSARRDPTRPRVLMLWLSTALRHLEDPAGFARRLQANLAQDEGDHVSRFMVGVLQHYDNAFEASNETLRQVEAVFDHEARVHVYLAMNDFNLGRVDEALARLESQIARYGGDGDPDLYYCRAEILRDTNRAQSIADLQRYFDQGHKVPTSNPTKVKRVQGMIAALQGCLKTGDTVCDGPWEHPRLAMQRRGAPPWWVLVYLGASLALVVLVVFRRLGRKRRRLRRA